MHVQQLLSDYNPALPAADKEQIRQTLAAQINHLLLHDFQVLVQLLYRTDVSEQKLKTILKENKETDAGDLIAELLIQRQEEKAAFKNSFPPTKEIDADEAW